MKAKRPIRFPADVWHQAIRNLYPLDPLRAAIRRALYR